MHHGAYHLIKKEPEPREGVFQMISNVFFNQLAYVVGVASSLFNIPQLITIWIDKDASGVSVLSWLGFSLASLFWLFYAIHHKEKALVITFSLTLVFQILIVIGAVMFG
jgi:uncharacterized protein with PQ loop repeat